MCLPFIFLMLNVTNSFSITNSEIDYEAFHILLKDTTLKNDARIKALQKLTESYYINKNNDAAIKYGIELLKESKEKKDDLHESIAANILGIIFLEREDYKKAEKYFKNALKANKSINDDRRISESYNKLGSVYFYSGDSKKALRNYNKSLKINKINKDNELISNSLNFIGDVYYYQYSELGKAKEHYLKGFEVLEGMEKQNLELLLTLLNNLGLVSIALGENDTALLYLRKAIKASKSDDKLAGTYRNIAYVYQQKRKYSKAEENLNKSLKIALKKNDEKEVLSSYKALYEHFKKTSNFEKSLEIFEKYISLNQDFNKSKIKDELMKQKYEFDYKQRQIIDSVNFAKKEEINDLEHRIIIGKEEKIRNTILFILISIIIIIAIIYYYRMNKNKDERENLLQQIKLLKAETLLKQRRLDDIPENIDYQKLELNKEKIEKEIGTSLNLTDWNILTALYNNPTITNKELSETVNLSVAGVRSSLQKMYKIFNLEKSKGEMRLSLIVVASKISIS